MYGRFMCKEKRKLGSWGLSALACPGDEFKWVNMIDNHSQVFIQKERECVEGSEDG